MKIFLVLVLFFSFSINSQESEEKVEEVTGPTQDETQANDLYKKYPEIEKVVNNAPVIEGAPDVKCPAECQSSQMTCTRGAGPEKRDECKAGYSNCMSNCGGFMDGMDMESLNNPGEMLKDVQLPENLKNAAIKQGQGQGEFTGFNNSGQAQAGSAPEVEAPKSQNMDDVFGGGASK